MLRKKLQREDYHVAWISPVSNLEMLPSCLMLDEDHDTPDYDSSYDDNVYTFGSVAGHNVVIATCPPGLTGNVNAGRVTGAMFKTFSSLRMAILVGIGGGVPEITHSQDPMENLHLGDVVVGWPADGGDACVAYDAGRWHTDGHFEVLGTINRPDRVLLNALGKLMLDHQMGKTTFHEHRDRLVNSKHRRKFAFPGLEKDQLYQANYKHSGVYGDGCKDCEHSKVVSRPLRTEEDVQEFVFHQGRIATGNAVVQDGEYRDEISRRCGKSVLCIEMEAAGVDASRAALVIRGISDYSDSHKGDAWRSYAAGNAAIFARELLSKITPATVQKMEIQDSKAEQEKVLRWFIDCSSEDQHRDIRKKQPLEDTTAEWFYQSDEAASVTFRSWRDQAPVSTHDRLLWAYGHPAAGKTVVVSQVIEHLRKHFCSPSQPHPRRTGIAYSYISMLNKYSTVEKSFTPELLILSLTRALLEQLPNVPASSKQFFEANRLRMSRLLDSSQVVGHLKDLCKLMFDDVYVIVDGLDEMGEKEMHRTIEYLKDLPPNIKIMFVSRYMDAIRDAIGTSFSLHIRAHEHDVKLYFAKEVEENSTFAALLKEAERAKPGQRSITEKALVRQAMFSFAAAKLCMEMLLRVRTPYELQQTVDDLPPPHEMYQNIFRRIKSRWDGSDRDWTKKILTWVCFARWTLSPWQLLYIIGLDFQHPNLNHTNLLAPESLLTSLCDGLVLVDEATQKVSIFHLDVLQFFQSNEQTYFPDAHHDIAEMCVAHIKAASALGLGIKQHPLRGFTIDAIRYLGYHVRTYMAHAEPDLGHPVRRLTSQSLTSSEDSGFSRDLQRNTMSTKSADLCDKLASLLNDERCLLLLNVIMVQHRLHSEEEMFAGDGATKLHVAAAMGFLDTTQRLAVDSQLLSVEDNFGRTALNVAIEWKHSDVAESLVKLGSQVEIEKPSGQTIFAMIVSQGNIKLALNLLKAAETPHKHRNPFRSRSHTNDPVSLLSATLNNDEGEVQRLISDAELRRSHAAETSLLVAADRGHQKILEILLNGDVSVDTSDIQDRTALHRAACRNDVNMVNTLIRHGADVNAIDKAGYTPWTSILFLPDHDEVEKILVSCSANVNASDYAGVSVLYTAASGGHVAVVNKLIEAGVDPTPRTVFGWTPLHWCPSFDIVSTLIEAGADVNAISDTTITPLERAVQGSEHKEHMRLGLFKYKAMPSAKSLDMTPEHPGGQCAACNMSIDANEICFSCSSCDSHNGIVLCCVCFLCDSWCGDTTHRLTSSWVHPNGCAEDVQIDLLERDALKQGSIVALLRSRGAMMSEEVRRHYESKLGKPISTNTFKWLAACRAICTVDEDIHERWLSVFADDETTPGGDESSTDWQVSEENLSCSSQGQASKDFLPQGSSTELDQDGQETSTKTRRWKAKAKKLLPRRS